MSHSIFSSDAPHPEASSLTAFAENQLDRQAEHRDEESVLKAVSTEGTHILAFAKDKLVLKHDGQVLDPLFARYELTELDPDWENAVLLGYRRTGEQRLAVPVRVDADDLASHFKPADMRSLWRDLLLEGEILGEAAQGVSLIRWNSDNRFCGRCGSLTESRIGGYKRVCVACEHIIFPRTDPVVIMLTIDQHAIFACSAAATILRRGCIPALQASSSQETIETPSAANARGGGTPLTCSLSYFPPWPMHS